MWNRVTTSLTNLLRSFVSNESLPFGAGCTASTTAALAVDLTTVAALLICACIVADVDASPLGPLGMALAFDLDSLLLDGGAVASPPVDDDGSGVFTSSDADLSG